MGVVRSATFDLPAAMSMCRLAMSATDSWTSPTFPSSASPGTPIARKNSFVRKNAGRKSENVRNSVWGGIDNLCACCHPGMGALETGTGGEKYPL